MSERAETIIPAGSEYLCSKCGCYGGKFCVDWSLHSFEQPQRVSSASAGSVSGAGDET